MSRQVNSLGYSLDFVRRRTTMTISTMTARMPATTRIIVVESIAAPFVCLNVGLVSIYLAAIMRISMITAGPRITIIKAGKIKKTSAGTILTDVLALISSARCRRLVRRSSE